MTSAISGMVEEYRSQQLAAGRQVLERLGCAEYAAWRVAQMASRTLWRIRARRRKNWAPLALEIWKAREGAGCLVTNKCRRAKGGGRSTLRMATALSLYVSKSHGKGGKVAMYSAVKGTVHRRQRGRGGRRDESKGRAAFHRGHKGGRGALIGSDGVHSGRVMGEAGA